MPHYTIGTKHPPQRRPSFNQRIATAPLHNPDHPLPFRRSGPRGSVRGGGRGRRGRGEQAARHLRGGGRERQRLALGGRVGCCATRPPRGALRPLRRGGLLRADILQTRPVPPRQPPLTTPMPTPLWPTPPRQLRPATATYPETLSAQFGVVDTKLARPANPGASRQPHRPTAAPCPTPPPSRPTILGSR